jgi:large subunit ribosomal protein L10
MKLEKQAICKDIRAWLGEAAYVLWVDYRGLKVRQTDELRKRLAKLPAEMHIVPNRLCRRVLAELKWDQADEAFVGPTALISGSGDSVAAAKLLKNFVEEQRLPRVKLGRFDGRFYQPADIEAIVQLPAKPVLHAMLAGTVAAPLTRLVGVLNRKLSSLVYVLMAIHAKKSQAK